MDDEGSGHREPGHGSRHPDHGGDRGDVGVVVPAAGLGHRMGGLRKAYLELLGEPLLQHALRPFLDHEAVVTIAVAIHPEDVESPPGWLSSLDPRVRLVAGGTSRAGSVRAALHLLDPPPPIVAVHDAARPLVNRGMLDRCFAVARAGEGAVAGWPAVDTLKEVGEGDLVLGSPERTRFWQAQTPQVFPGSTLVEAYRSMGEEGSGATDDAAIVARLGLPIRMVRGSRWNLKVTHPEDVPVAEDLLRRRRALPEVPEAGG